MHKTIPQIVEEITQYAQDPKTTAEAFKLRYLSKKGLIATLFATLKNEAPEQKKTKGQTLNALKQKAETLYASLCSQTNTATSTTSEDLTRPPADSTSGTLHPLRHTEQRIIEILTAIGFQIVEGNEIEDDWHNFAALNFPEHHPARAMQDTFFLEKNTAFALRPHTSCVQIRTMEENKPPIRVITYGRVYRNETISARSHCMFHQIEALYIDKNVTFVAFQETLDYFVRALFGPGIATRLRPSYFPFTEPSAEIDIACPLCKGKKCTICKHTGWVEIGGAGMVDPKVLENVKIDPQIYSGYAWGMGIERITMLLHQINDVRLFTENSLDFLTQFHA